MNALLKRTLWDAYAEEADDVTLAQDRRTSRELVEPPERFTYLDSLDSPEEYRTYVGLRRPEGWQLMAITSAGTTLLWDGAPVQTGLHLVRDEASGMANALLEDLVGCRPSVRARAALSRKIVAELGDRTFVFHGRELRAWLLERRLEPGTWAS
jgi:hypothetical protein